MSPCQRLSLFCRAERALHRDAEVRPRSLRQELQRGAVRIGQFARNVEPQAGAARSRGKKRLEDLPAQLRGNSLPVVVELQYYGIAHVPGARQDANAVFLLLAMLPRVAHQVPNDLIQVATIEDHQQVVGNLHDDAARRNRLGLNDLVDQRGHELDHGHDFGLLAVAAVQLQYFADDAVDALGVVANHREQSLAFRRDRAVFLEELSGLVDRGQRVAHLVRDARCKPAHGCQLHLLRLGLCPSQVLEVDERAAVQPGADAHQAHAQQTLRYIDLERRQGLGEILLPPAPVVVQSRAEFGQSHPAAHAPEAAQESRHLRVMATDNAVQVDDQHAVLHVLNDETIDLLEIGDVNAALRREILARLGVTAECERNADGREVAESDQAGLEQLGAGYDALKQPPAVEREQYRAREGGVEECDLRAHQPAAGGELRKQQDRQRSAGRAAGRDE